MIDIFLAVAQVKLVCGSICPYAEVSFDKTLNPKLVPVGQASAFNGNILKCFGNR